MLRKLQAVLNGPYGVGLFAAVAAGMVNYLYYHVVDLWPAGMVGVVSWLFALFFTRVSGKLQKRYQEDE